MKFYPRSWARYAEAVPKTIKLSPPEYRLAALRADYIAMQDMLYGNVADYVTVMEAIRTLEHEIHSL